MSEYYYNLDFIYRNVYTLPSATIKVNKFNITKTSYYKIKILDYFFYNKKNLLLTISF